jgi:hypothetical protein
MPGTAHMLYDKEPPEQSDEVQCVLWACALALGAWLVIHFSIA